MARITTSSSVPRPNAPRQAQSPTVALTKKRSALQLRGPGPKDTHAAVASRATTASRPIQSPARLPANSVASRLAPAKMNADTAA